MTIALGQTEVSDMATSKDTGGQRQTTRRADETEQVEAGRTPNRSGARRS